MENGDFCQILHSLYEMGLAETAVTQVTVATILQLHEVTEDRQFLEPKNPCYIEIQIKETSNLIPLVLYNYTPTPLEENDT